jgi:hypothetical protein
MNQATSPRRSLRRARPASPTCRGGASSVLRLSQPSLPRLPAGADVEAWLERTLGLMAQADTDWAPDEHCPSMITRLQPSHEWRAR